MEAVPLPLAQPPLQARSTQSSQSAHRILDAPRPLALWHLASLDAPTVAVVWSLAFAWAAGISLPRWVPLLLALATWSVYIGDRLLDVRAGLRSPALRILRERHYFHWRFRRILLPLAVAAASAAAVLIFTFMPVVARERNSVLAAAALAYFCGVHGMNGPARPAFPLQLPKWTKEFLVGLLFTTGCVLPVWSRIHLSTNSASLLWPFWIPAIYFAVLAFLNCWSIARWESAEVLPASASVRARQTQWIWRRCLSANFAFLLAIAGLLLAFFAPASQARSAALLTAAAASALLLALLDIARNRLTPCALRSAADLVLLTPLLLLL